MAKHVWLCFCIFLVVVTVPGTVFMIKCLDQGECPTKPEDFSDDYNSEGYCENDNCISRQQSCPFDCAKCQKMCTFGMTLLICSGIIVGLPLGILLLYGMAWCFCEGYKNNRKQQVVYYKL
jgi:hypothetical protein